MTDRFGTVTSVRARVVGCDVGCDVGGDVGRVVGAPATGSQITRDSRHGC